MIRSSTFQGAAAGALLALAACSSAPTDLASAQRVPSAEGTVKAERTEDQNTRVELNVKHLAPPQRVAQGTTAYVVWVEPSQGGAPSNIGAFGVDRNLEGKLTSLTPLHDFKIYVTAEPTGQASSPTGEQLLWTSISSG